MKIWKQFLTSIFSSALFCAAIPAAECIMPNTMQMTASAIGSHEASYDGILKYTIYCMDDVPIEPKNADYIAITDCDPSATSVVIPSEIQGVPITAIGANAFAECTSLTDITIPDSIIDIGANALNDTPYFAALKAANPYVIINGILVDCPQRTGDIVVPDGVTNISAGAFDHSEVTSVVLPDSVTRIGSNAFAGAENLTSINMPSNLKSIGRAAFLNCNKLPNLQFPDSLTKIEYEAFRECFAMTEITLPKNVIEIGDYAFQDCYHVTNLTLPDALETIGDYAFENLACTSVQIPEHVTEIGANAFRNCDELAEIKIPESVSKFGAYAFEGTSWLDAKRTEDPLVMINGILIDGKTYSGELVIPDTVYSISDNAFSGNSTLTSVAIPRTVQDVGVDVFRNCSALTQISLPDNWRQNLPEGMFESCNALTCVTIPKGIVTIESDVFENCKKLETVIISTDLTLVKHYAFDCPSLKTIYYTGTEEQWNNVEIWNTNTPLLEAQVCFRCIGDTNLDGAVDITDLVLLSQAYVGAVQLDDIAVFNADCNDDGVTNLHDILYLLQMLTE